MNNMFLPGFLILTGEIPAGDSAGFGGGTGTSGQTKLGPDGTEYFYMTIADDGVENDGWYYFNETGELAYYGATAGSDWTDP